MSPTHRARPALKGEPAIATPQSHVHFSLPPVERRQLPNGARLLAAHNGASETTVLSGMIVGGAALDPTGREGLASFTASVAQRATTEQSYEQIYDRLDALGASLGMGAGTHTVSFHAKCLSRDWEALAALVIELLRGPSFPQAEFDKARGELLTSLRQVDQDTGSVAARDLGHLVYPEGHPFHHPTHGYYHSVEPLTRDDLADCHRRLARPDALTLTVVGNVAPGQALDTLDGLVADWERPATPLAQPAFDAAHPAEPQRTETVLADKTQCDIALGFKAIPRSHDDWYALDQATQIVGGMGLMGRLGDNVRDRQGLAYYVYARTQDSFGDALWSVRAGVNPANVEKACDSILHEIRTIQDDPVADQELADVQSYLVGVLPLRLETNDGVAGTLNGMALYDLGDDYVERYPDIIRSVTKADIQRTAQAHLTAERHSLAIAGPARS